MQAGLALVDSILYAGTTWYMTVSAPHLSQGLRLSANPFVESAAQSYKGQDNPISSPLCCMVDLCCIFKCRNLVVELIRRCS